MQYCFYTGFFCNAVEERMTFVIAPIEIHHCKYLSAPFRSFMVILIMSHLLTFSYILDV